jgi:hypothetical protein
MMRIGSLMPRRELDRVDAVLVGPSSAKLELISYLHAHERAIESKVVGVESADHPTDGGIVAHARATSRRATEWARCS